MSNFKRRLEQLRWKYGLTQEPEEPVTVSQEMWEERLVHKTTSIVLSEEETAVLRRGLNFAVCPRKVPRSDFIASIECVITACSAEEKVHVRRKASAALNSARSHRTNLSRGETDAIKKLREFEDIVILPSDKGKETSWP